MEKQNNIEIGRVLRANTSGFELGCRVQQLSIPEFGGLVKAISASDEAIYGLIYNIHIDDDPLVGRLVLQNEIRPEDINDQRENRILPIEMSVLSLGQVKNETLIYGLPPRPPLNLDAVLIVRDHAEIVRFTNKLTYLRLILRGDQNNVPIDQLLVAHIRHIYKLRDNDNAWAMRMIREVIELLRSDYNTLIPTLEALSDALPTLPTTLLDKELI